MTRWPLAALLALGPLVFGARPALSATAENATLLETSGDDLMEECVEELTEDLALSNIFKLCPEKLAELYRRGQPGPVPRGDTRGKASFNPGSVISPIEQGILRGFWSGKVFVHQPDGTVTLLNKTPLGQIIPAKVYVAESKLDGKSSIIIDYTEDLNMPIVGWLIGNIRDEIRRVAPGLYLGYAFLKRGGGYVNVLPFALDTSHNTVQEPAVPEPAPQAP